MLEIQDHIFSSLPLWIHFNKKTLNNVSERNMLLHAVNNALPLLDNINIAFPTYTLHNTQHQYNIIRIIGELLGEKLNDLTGLEAGFLILAAVYHDIGMVYNIEDLANVPKEPEFQDFLNSNATARIQYETTGHKVSRDLTGWYCRWAHAKRVWLYLNKYDANRPLTWKSIPIKNELGFLCESHNESVEYIKVHSNDFDNNFLGECDLTFCAILLRLADILDFDNTRSPLSVFEYLKLDQARTASDKASKIEWNKHLSSNGFKFEKLKGKPIIRFIAAPDHPSIEVAIRKFLTIIQSEIEACSKLIHFCSERWRSFELPQEINIDGIKSRNYRSGNYQFSLAEDDVLKLLTGDNLYNDEFVFIRELVQNAIDTSRHREFKERFHDPSFKATAIEISFFNDNEGYQWLRVDDFGMGMNLKIIENHLLKKGKSYYTSDAFKLEKLIIRETIENDFVPISRFGIGLLSCFIAGDRIEINTLHKDDPGNPFRLSVEGREGLFVLQSKKDHHTPLPMPAESGFELSYRSSPGTSIAVRIITNREFDGFDIENQLQRYLLAPPVKVFYNRKPISRDCEELLHTQWGEFQSFEMGLEFRSSINKLTGIWIAEGLRVNVLPIDLSKDSLAKDLKGQMLLMYVDLPVEASNRLFKVGFKLELYEDKLTISCIKNYNDFYGATSMKSVSEDISFILKKVRIPKEVIRSPFVNNHQFNGIKLSHNGIRINESGKKYFQLNESLINKHLPSDSKSKIHSFISYGLIYFQDELLPTLSISRDEILQISFPIIANVATALRSLGNLDQLNSLTFNYSYLVENEFESDYDSRTIENCQFYEKNEGFWNKEIILKTDSGERTIAELIEEEPKKLGFDFVFYKSIFYRNLVRYVLEKNFDILVEKKNIAGKARKKYYLTRKTNLPLEGVKGFPPLTFLNYHESITSLRPDDRLNLGHPYIKWYMSAYPFLSENYSYYSKQLIRNLLLPVAKVNTDNINRILNKLRTVLPTDIRPPKNIDLEPKDLEQFQFSGAVID